MFSHGVASSVEWHPGSQDPDAEDLYLGSTSDVNARWMARTDYGNGKPLDSAAVPPLFFSLLLSSLELSDTTLNEP